MYFEVKDGETPSDLGPRLQSAGLIRNGAVFTYYTKYIKQFNLKSGVYTLSPGETMDKIIQTLETASPIPQVCVTIPPGMRVLEYTGAVTPKKKGCTEYADDDPQKPAPAPRFHDLPRFNAENFMKIVTTGKYMDGTNVSDSYWFVAALQKTRSSRSKATSIPTPTPSTRPTPRKMSSIACSTSSGWYSAPARTTTGAYFNDAKSCRAHGEGRRGQEYRHPDRRQGQVLHP